MNAHEYTVVQETQFTQDGAEHTGRCKGETQFTQDGAEHTSRCKGVGNEHQGAKAQRHEVHKYRGT